MDSCGKIKKIKAPYVKLRVSQYEYRCGHNVDVIFSNSGCQSWLRLDLIKICLELVN